MAKIMHESSFAFFFSRVSAAERMIAQSIASKCVHPQFKIGKAPKINMQVNRLQERTQKQQPTD
jgi:hypothetical protein